MEIDYLTRYVLVDRRVQTRLSIKMLTPIFIMPGTPDVRLEDLDKI